MNSEFIAANKDKYTFGLEEILNQTCPRYDYGTLSEYRNRDSLSYYSKDKPSYLKQLKNHCDTQQAKVEAVLTAVGCDTSAFRSGRRFEIPILIAELIYVLSMSDSSKGSAVSKLKTGKQLSIEEKDSLMRDLLTELADDYGTDDDRDPIAQGIRESCERMQEYRIQQLRMFDRLRKLREQLDLIMQEFCARMSVLDIPCHSSPEEGKEEEKTAMEKLQRDLDALERVVAQQCSVPPEIELLISQAEQAIETLKSAFSKMRK